jgi:hypothetical protein
MPSSGMLCCVALVRIDISEECIASVIRVTLMMEAIHSSEMLVLTRAIWHNIPEDSILHLSSITKIKLWILHCLRICSLYLVQQVQTFEPYENIPVGLLYHKWHYSVLQYTNLLLSMILPLRPSLPSTSAVGTLACIWVASSSKREL